MAARKGEDWIDHLTRLERHATGSRRSDLRYRLVTRVLNAGDYGVPQRRERVVFVGFRDDLDIEWGFPKETHSLDALLWDQSRGDYSDIHGVAKKARVLTPRARNRARRLEERPAALAWRTVRDAIHDLPDPERDPPTGVHDHCLQPGARSYPGHSGSPLDEPAKLSRPEFMAFPAAKTCSRSRTGQCDISPFERAPAFRPSRMIGV